MGEKRCEKSGKGFQKKSLGTTKLELHVKCQKKSPAARFSETTPFDLTGHERALSNDANRNGNHFGQMIVSWELAQPWCSNSSPF